MHMNIGCAASEASEAIKRLQFHPFETTFGASEAPWYGASIYDGLKVDFEIGPTKKINFAIKRLQFHSFEATVGASGAPGRVYADYDGFRAEFYVDSKNGPLGFHPERFFFEWNGFVLSGKNPPGKKPSTQKKTIPPKKKTRPTLINTSHLLALSLPLTALDIQKEGGRRQRRNP